MELGLIRESLNRSDRGQFLCGLAIIVFIASICLDKLHAIHFDHRFYWSEAILFELKWLLFIPGYLAIERVVPGRFKGGLRTAFMYRVLISGLIWTVAHLIVLTIIIAFVNYLLGQAPFRSLFLNLAENNLLFIFLVYNCLIYLSMRYSPELMKTAVEDHISYPEKLPIERRGQTTYLNLSEIVLIQSTMGFATIYVDDGRTHLCDQSLASLEKSLNPNLFCRIHRRSLIHVSKVREEISRGNGDYDLVLSNKMDCRLSRRYRASFRKLMLAQQL